MKYLLSSVLSFYFLSLLHIYYIINFNKNQLRFFLVRMERFELPTFRAQTELHPYNWWGEKESNLRRWDLQSHALPTELSPHKNKTE